MDARGNGGQAKQALRPFRTNTMPIQQLNQKSNALAHTLGSIVNYQFDKNGALAGIWFVLRGTVTLSSGGALANLGPWNIVKRFRLTLNNNANVVIDVDGYHAYLLGLTMKSVWGADGGGNYTPNALTYSAPVANGANTWVIPYFLPCSLNPGSDVLDGAINMQAQTANLNLEVTLESTGTNVVSNFSSLSLTGFVYNMSYELRKGTEIPPLVLVQRQQKTDNITAVGDTIHEIIPQGDLYMLLSSVILNSVRDSANVTNVKFRAGATKFNYIHDPFLNHSLFQQMYGKPAPTGIFVLDLFSAMDVPWSGDLMNIIKTNNFTELDWIANVASTATLGALAQFNTVEVRVVPLQLD